jgi:hypothetical protein
LDELVATVASGMNYMPVNKADLARGVPTQGWNVPDGLLKVPTGGGRHE